QELRESVNPAGLAGFSNPLEKSVSGLCNRASLPQLVAPPFGLTRKPQLARCNAPAGAARTSRERCRPDDGGQATNSLPTCLASSPLDCEDRVLKTRCVMAIDRALILLREGQVQRQSNNRSQIPRSAGASAPCAGR